MLDGVSVHESRKRAGAVLAREYPVAADVVIGVPDSGLDAALGYSEASGIPYGIGLIKNKYVGRTFIQPSQSARLDQVRIKLSAIGSSVCGKRIVLIDDSIVRGTTAAESSGCCVGGRGRDSYAGILAEVSLSMLLRNGY